MTRTRRIPSALTRREWLRLVGAAATSLAAGCTTDRAGAPDAAAAVLEPTADGFLVAVWARRAREVTVAVRSGAAMTMRTIVLGEGGSGLVEVAGLGPATACEIIARTSDGILLGPHHARTAPADDDVRAVRIAVAADVDPNPEFDSDLVDHVIAADPDLLVSLGDFPYTDNGPPAFELATYRERHVEVRTTPRVRALLEAMPLRAIYDDHEFRNDWDAGFVRTEAARYAAAMTAWDEFFPVRDPRSDIRYRSWRQGAHVECFLLDCRRFRSANAATDDGAKTMLGDAQRQWFFDGIAASTAPFKLVFTSVPLDFAVGVDAWTGFVREREQLFDALVGIPGILFVSADQHFFAAHRHAYGIREIQIGPLARGIGKPAPAEPGVLHRAERYNVGVIDVTAEHLVVAGLGEGGERFYEETLTPADLTPRRG